MPAPSVDAITQFLRDLAEPSPAASDVERIDRIRALEGLKAAASAAQARETVAFRRSQLAEQESLRVPARDHGRGISAQVALARRESPHRGGRSLGLATALVEEMPQTLAALERGEISEWRATLVVRETACLSAGDRRRVDDELAGRLADWGDRQVVAETRKVAYRLDPQDVTARSRRAEGERSVTLRPAPDTMTYLTALLPVKQGVAAYAALVGAAGAAAARGDDRSRGQLMADTLVERVTGQRPGDLPVEVQLVVADTTLSGEDDSPGHVSGYGPVPAPWAREMLRGGEAGGWLRRLYTRGGRLIAMDSDRREFPPGLRRLLIARDQTCRTPWCDAPIRHADHVLSAEAGGATDERNGQGLCAACNFAKQAPRWRAHPGPRGAGVSTELTTPTGHTYLSQPPDPPDRVPRTDSRLELFARDLLLVLAA